MVKVHYWLLILLFCSSVTCRLVQYAPVATYTKAKTLKIERFENESGNGPPNLAQRFTENLRNYYLQNSRLALTNDQAELLIEGEIRNYTVSPLSPTSQDQAAQTRLTIEVRVRFTNYLDESENFEQSFTQYGDFPQGVSLQQVEDEKIREIFDKIIFDVFQKTVANW